MTKRRDRRQFGPGPYVLGLERLYTGNDFPFSIPAAADIDALDLSVPITLLAGENGTGKSTIVEALATMMGFSDQGGELERLGELPPVSRELRNDRDEPLLAPVLGRARPRNGYFLRAESFFNVAAFIDSGDRYAPDLSIYGDVPLHQQSHGESFLALAANRFGGESLYLLDEPEAALSVTGLLALLAIVARACDAGAQFVIATHSPVLLAAPGARIYELAQQGLSQAAYDDLESVRQIRGFLDAPDRYLRQITPGQRPDE